MNFECLREDLSVLSLLDDIVQETSILVSLGTFKIETGLDVIHITATNLETTIIAHIPAKVSESGSICVPRRLAALVKELTGDVVKFKLGTKLSVSCGSARSTLPVMDATDFPNPNVMSVAKDKCEFLVGAASLANILDIAQTSATAKQKQATILKGVCLVVEKDILTAVGADGVRMSMSSIGIMASTPLDRIEATIPTNSVKALITALKDGDRARVMISANSGGAVGIRVVCSDTVEIMSKVYEGRFPDFRMLIPKEFASVVSVNPDEMTKALKIVKVTADDKDSIVMAPVTGDTDGERWLSLESDMTMGVDGAVTVMVNHTSSGWDDTPEVGVSPTYLMAGLKCFGDIPEVNMEFNGPNGMIKLSAEDMETIVLLMPMAIRS